jgi:hypothetical protein
LVGYEPSGTGPIPDATVDAPPPVDVGRAVEAGEDAPRDGAVAKDAGGPKDAGPDTPTGEAATADSGDLETGAFETGGPDTSSGDAGCTGPFLFVPTNGCCGPVAVFATAIAETRLETTVAADAAYIGYDATLLYLGIGGHDPTAAAGGSWPPNDPGTYVVMYLGNGQAGAMSGVAVYDGGPLPMPAQIAIIWQASGGSAASSVYALAWNGSVWATAPFTPTVSYQSGANVAFSVPLEVLGSGASTSLPSVITMYGYVAVGVGTSSAAPFETFPANGYVDATLASCLGPAQQVR